MEFTFSSRLLPVLFRYTCSTFNVQRSASASDEVETGGSGSARVLRLLISSRLGIVASYLAQCFHADAGCRCCIPANDNLHTQAVI